MNLSERLKASWFACSLLFLDAFSLFSFIPTLRLEMCFMFVARRFYNVSFFSRRRFQNFLASSPKVGSIHRLGVFAAQTQPKKRALRALNRGSRGHNPEMLRQWSNFNHFLSERRHKSSQFSVRTLEPNLVHTRSSHHNETFSDGNCARRPRGELLYALP